MKKMEIIIRPEKPEDLKIILVDCKAGGIMISNGMGYGTQKGRTQMYRGTSGFFRSYPPADGSGMKAADRICEKSPGVLQPDR